MCEDYEYHCGCWRTKYSVLYNTPVVAAPAAISKPSGFRGARSADRVLSSRYVSDHATRPRQPSSKARVRTWGAPLAMPEPFSLSPAARA
jgi:hypothetical protein